MSRLFREEKKSRNEVSEQRIDIPYVRHRANTLRKLLLFYALVGTIIRKLDLAKAEIRYIVPGIAPGIIMPPKRLKKKSVKRLVEKRVAKAIEKYEKTRANSDKVGSPGGNTENVRGTGSVQGCSHKTFINGKPHPFNGTEGVVGLRRWIEKVEKVFEIFNCAEEDKVMFAASTFEGRALTWWNGNVHTLGLVNANRIP
ncbi:hypothetical protein Tco_1392745 [Tanacetum coccineum]